MWGSSGVPREARQAWAWLGEAWARLGRGLGEAWARPFSKARTPLEGVGEARLREGLGRLGEGVGEGRLREGLARPGQSLVGLGEAWARPGRGVGARRDASVRLGRVLSDVTRRAFPV